MENSIVLKDMGSFAFGGSVVTKDNGETFHGEHGYTQYFVPDRATNYPVVLWLHFAPPSGHRCVCQRTLSGGNGQRFNQPLSARS